MEVSTNHTLNIALLSTELAKEAWHNTFWAKLAGFQGITNVNGIKQTNPAPNVVVQMVRDFVAEGRDNLLAAMLMPLSEDPVYGDTQLKGTGEDMSLKYVRLYINQVRKAVTKLSGNMSNQRVKSFNLMEKAKPALVDWWSKWYNAAMFQTIYEGVSPQLSAGTNDDGLGLQMRYHPNQYYSSSATEASNVLTAIGTNTTEKYLKTEANYQTSDAAILGYMDANLINQMNSKMKTTLLIEPILSEEGVPFWLWLVHPEQFRRMKQNANIYRTQDAAFNGQLRKHPAILGRDIMYYDGFCFVEETTGVRSMPTSGSVARYISFAGTNGWTKPPTSGSGYAYGGIILGKNALALGVAENLTFTEETEDHGNTIEIGSRCIQGANRVEFFSETDEALVFVKNKTTRTLYDTAALASNQSSAIVWTL